MSNEDLDVLVADILDGLGEHERASWIRSGVGPLTEDVERGAQAILDEIYAVVEDVPDSTDKHTHTMDAPAERDAAGKITEKATVACWRTRAQCLAEKLRVMIDEGTDT